MTRDPISDPLDRAAIKALKAAAKKATPGPWRYVRAGKFRSGSTEHGIGSLYGPDVLIYTTPDDDETRGCDCGLDAALSRLRGETTGGTAELSLLRPGEDGDV